MNNKNKPQSIVLPVMFVSLVMLLLLAAGWQLAESNFENIAPIEKVEIEGAFENLALPEVRQTVTSVLDGGYFTVNLHVIRQALLNLPWVEDASIRRQWPGGLHIKVIEKQAVAFWGDKSLLSNKGVLFSPASIDASQALAKLDGPEGQHKKVWGFLAGIRKDFEAMGLEVEQLVLDERRAWSMKISGRNFSGPVEVKLGRTDSAEHLARFVRVFSDNKILATDSVDVIDMRYPNGFAMRMRNKATGTKINIAGPVREV